MPDEFREMLIRIDERTQQMARNLDAHIDAVKEHVRQDAIDFKEMKKRIFYLTLGVVVIGVVIGGPDLVFKLIGK